MGHVCQALTPGDLFPGLPAADALRPLGDDVRSRARRLVARLDEDPALLAGLRQPEAPAELLAGEGE